MTPFLSRLLNRHTLMDNVVKPRFITMFETDDLAVNTGKFDENYSEKFSDKRPADDDRSDRFTDYNKKYNSGIHAARADRLANDKLEPADKNSKAPMHTGGEVPNQPDEEHQIMPVSNTEPFDRLNVTLESAVKPDRESAFEPVSPVPVINSEGNTIQNALPVSGKGREKALSESTGTPALGKAGRSEVKAVDGMNKDNGNKNLPPGALKKRGMYADEFKQNITLPALNYWQLSGFIKTSSFKNILQTEPSKATIKITIGQIDIKAIPEVKQFAPVKSKSAQVPRMSLDDYLKMRNSN